MSSLRSPRLWAGGLLVVAAGLLCGCGGSLSTRRASEAGFPVHSRVAILPFDNFTDQDLVSGKVTAYFEAAMAGRDEFTLIENGATFEALRRLRVRSVAVLREGQIDSLAQALQADYFLTGAVLEYREIGDKFLVKIPQVSINARLIDGKTGATVWTAVSNDSGDRTELLFGLGAVKSAEELARRMVESMVQDIRSLFR